MLSDKFMGRKSKYEKAGAKLAEEIESGLSLCEKFRIEIETKMELAKDDPEVNFPVNAAKSYLSMLQNTVKTKMAYDQANKAFADGLSATQQQDVIVTWIAQMAGETQKRFLAKLDLALKTGKLPEIDYASEAQ